ncbi:limonene-1,2-epoxide hydrolase [Mangrovimicrobium sediminis]|uniref:Limonene-1,2-epoxide hydrolase n=1 Tax=Mangrovimicrobium sediminis TaxID=2562682 RepID=A0A4Z0M9D5_9GAMM|nr:limonene-1,2-epoxide hydrolase family protein [Haliea sp. SAOS-164]TGD76129.1 limonene-1,2-epoxide hydrolase [Haliea sp. SAOS-164]
MPTNAEIVTEFVHCWADKDIDRIIDYFTDDAVYINIPMDPPNHGKAEIRAMIEGFIGSAEAMDFEIFHQAESPDGIVMNERCDRFLMGGQWVELPVMGIFELEKGKIKAWRDYFDLNQFTSRMPQAAG